MSAGSDGMHLRQAHALGANAHVGDDRTRYAGRDERHGALDRLVRTYELRGPASVDGELLDERRVDVGCRHRR